MRALRTRTRDRAAPARNHPPIQTASTIFDRRTLLQFESLEARDVPAVTLLDPLTQPKFTNALPNPLAPGAQFAPVATGVDPDKDGKPGDLYRVGAYQISQPLGIVDPNGNSYSTAVWGYGTSQKTASFPGPTFVARRNRQVNVEWTNNLTDPNGQPLRHLLPVDSSLHWANPQKTGPGPYAGPVPIVSHLHGGHNRADSDGHPEAWFTPDGPDGGTAPDYTGRLYNRVYTYDNEQPAGTLWYHDHALGLTRLNVYAGLAGFYLLRDPAGGLDTGLPGNRAGLPAGPYEIPLAIQDRLFYGPGTNDDLNTPWFEAPGQLYYPSTPEPGTTAPAPSILPEFFGDHILVNGKIWPYLEVEPREYRFRILNGSDSRFYNLSLSNGGTIYQVGSDVALLDRAVPLRELTLGTGERADVVIDFSKYAGQTIILRNNAKTPFPNGATVDPRTTGQIMAFKVKAASQVNLAYPLTNVLKAPLGDPIPQLIQSGPTRALALFEGTDAYGRIQPQLGLARSAPGSTLNGSLLWDDPLTESIRLGDTEVWELYNATVDAHPIHLHLVHFQLLSRQKFAASVDSKPMSNGGTGGVLRNIRLIDGPAGPASHEAGWEDTIVVNPGEVVRLIARFDRVGEYVWHCHILSHEDNEMMRPFTVQRKGSGGAVIANTTSFDTAVPTSATSLVLSPAATDTTAPIRTLRDPMESQDEGWLSVARSGGRAGWVARFDLAAPPGDDEWLVDPLVLGELPRV